MSEILVIGDTCKDIYVYGSCDRLCPDYPVPSFIPSHEKQSLGMDGNVYQNILSLGARATLKTNSTVIEKTRYVDKKTNHMFLRVDSGEEKVQRVKGLTKDFLSKFKLIIISDYNKGFLLEKDIKFICDNHKQVFIDTKKNLGDFCKNSSFIKINQEEYKKSVDYINNNPSINDKIIQTLAGKGCKMADKHFHVEKVEIKDSCGAGDTFLAALCFKYLDTLKIHDSIVFANECATQVVQQRGVSVIKK
jgi:bifunctional ADP-heptose synthase (sugar kinase/adenylyltransferase)